MSCLRTLLFGTLFTAAGLTACSDDPGPSLRGRHREAGAVDSGGSDGDRAGAADSSVERGPGAAPTDRDAGKRSLDGGRVDADAEGGDCGASPFEAEPVEAHVLLLVDASKSMLLSPDGFDTDKWTALTGALELALTDVQDTLSFGLDAYPVDGACGVGNGPIEVAPGRGAAHVERVVSALQAWAPAGSTPTASALTRARTYFESGEGAGLAGEKYVLLATDGGPNCNEALTCARDACVPNMEMRCGDGEACEDCASNCCTHENAEVATSLHQNCLDDDATVQAVEALATAGIPTVVVGIPGSEVFADTLDALALAGGLPRSGTPNYYAVRADGGASGLADVLRGVTRSLIRSCALQLASRPPDLTKLNVDVDGDTLVQNGPDGWTLDESTEPPTIRLKGKTCDRLESEGAEHVQVTFGCPTEVI